MRYRQQVSQSLGVQLLADVPDHHRHMNNFQMYVPCTALIPTQHNCPKVFFLRICVYKRVLVSLGGSACCSAQRKARQHSSQSHTARSIITTLSPSDSSDDDAIVSPSLSLLIGTSQLCRSAQPLLTYVLSYAPSAPGHARPLNASIGLAPHSLKPANDGVRLVGGGCSPTLLLMWLWLSGG